MPLTLLRAETHSRLTKQPTLDDDKTSPAGGEVEHWRQTVIALRKLVAQQDRKLKDLEREVWYKVKP